MTNPVFVMGDDLTGAIDTGIYFRKGFSRVKVGFRTEEPWDFMQPADVIQVYDAESRNLSSAEAGARMGYAASLLPPDLHPRVYHKVDATLRGNLGSEISAILQGLGRSAAILAPAFPAIGRTVVNGHLHVDGVPLEQTMFSRDPLHPVKTSDIGEVVAGTTTVSVLPLSLAVIRKGSSEILQYIMDRGRVPAIYIADTAEDRDLIALAEACAPSDLILPCGSGGLARQVASYWTARGNRKDQDQDEALPLCDRVIVAIGSAHPESHKQLTALSQLREAYSVVLAPHQLAPVSARYMEEIRHGVLSDSSSLVTVALGADRVSSQYSGELTVLLANIVADKLKQWRARSSRERLGVIATGGETALAVAKALDVKAVWPEGNISAGIPWSRLQFLPSEDDMILVSKAGSFGSPNTLADIALTMVGRK